MINILTNSLSKKIDDMAVVLGDQRERHARLVKECRQLENKITALELRAQEDQIQALRKAQRKQRQKDDTHVREDTLVKVFYWGIAVVAIAVAIITAGLAVAYERQVLPIL